MKKIILLIMSILLFSCSNNDEVKKINEFQVTKNNIESTYKVENRSLNLQNKNIKTYINLNSYMSGTEVNNIFLGNNQLERINISGFDKLGKLEINNNNIRFIGDLKLPKMIRHINFSNNHLDSLKGLENYTNLKTLDLSNNNLEDNDFDLKPFVRLKYINVDGNKVSEEFLEKIKIFNTRYLLNNEVPYSNDRSSGL